MAVMLPEELEYPLELIGITWPNINEDALRDMAQAYRDHADAVEEAKATADTIAGELVTANTGSAIEAFGEDWGRISVDQLQGLADASRTIAGLLHTVAPSWRPASCR
ncbi:WXG100-like domain-containing protein [Allostreptomyces psammosilenae]|uniref:Uncharacterized protein YukE n=1 Tax=Allostreptomyces psammosilenae TaxID=1892865 RepID=A0A852ZY49_9ACTN|nr:hypothetical protein [Allostreptomyces psammosilenae]NYI07303.1 uncharacterized protein YukE [Allostreptomyces psammosilenae]